MDCLVYLLGLVCFSTRGNQQEKEFLVKAMKREGFQISLQIFCTALHKVSSKLLLKSTPLKGSFLPWQQYNGLLWGLHSPGLSVGCILAEITIEKWHPCSLGEPCNLFSIPWIQWHRKPQGPATSWSPELFPGGEKQSSGCCTVPQLL